MRVLSSIILFALSATVAVAEDGKCVAGDCTKGSGTAIWGADVYTGSFQNGKPGGPGTFKLADGRTFSGNFTNGEATGQFQVNYPDGSIYNGELVGGRRKGKGTLKSMRGIYRGEFDQDKIQGQGTFDFASGEVYKGE
ncbi:MAG TPA: hypothetical protein PKK45_18390, partial [Leptospiraceae bacterium]|nr:hypothetical protein [Leptospiraceae bacterium]